MLKYNKLIPTLKLWQLSIKLINLKKNLLPRLKINLEVGICHMSHQLDKYNTDISSKNALQPPPAFPKKGALSARL